MLALKTLLPLLCRSLAVLLLLSSVPIFPSPAAATTVVSTPRLSVILPRGVKRGGEHKLRFSGARLGDAEEVFLYDQGVTVTNLAVVDANNIDVTVQVASDCRLGEHLAQVRTRSGISDYRSFFIGQLNDVVEVEPNNEFSVAQAIEKNVTLNGVIQNEDQDFFKFSAKKGERISVEIEAIRLGAMIDPFISLLDANRFELAVADDSAFGKQDGVISLIAPADGEYTVLVRESAFGGNGASRYRLHVGTFPRPTVAYPAGGKPGSSLDVTFLGDAAGPIVQKITVPAEAAFRAGLFVTDDQGITPSPIQFRAVDLENVMETEDNGHWTETAAAPVPAAFNGIIQQPGDYDYFKFAAKKGQALRFQCYARRLGSGLDPVINVFRASNKQHLKGDDDARRPDCYMDLTIPEDGEYFLRVRDHLGRGQADFVYRVEVSTPTPSLRVEIPRVDRYSQLRQSIAVPQGNRFATIIRAARGGFGGELKMIAENLPPGITMIAPNMHAGLNVVPVVFEATADAQPAGALIDFKARHVDEAKNIVGSFFNIAEFALGQPNNARYYAAAADKLPVAVIDKLPFKLELVQPQVPLVRDGTMNIKIVAHRDEGFDAPIRIQFPFRPRGVGTTYQIEMPKGKNEVLYPMNANGSATVGKWPVYAIGWADVNGQAWASTQMAELNITPPYVTMQIKRTVCERGKSAQIVCKLVHATPFEGEAKAELLGLPPNISTKPLTFNKDTQELVFPVQTNDKSPVGKHRSVFCRITITQAGEPIVSTAGRTELQITKPKPPKKDESVKVKKS